jgi:serine/threonine-protein kinase
MLAGRPPFHGESPVDTLSAILREAPPADPALAGLSSAFERTLHRSLEKRPEDRYQSAGELAVDLRRIAADPASAARDSRRRPGLGSALRTLFRPSSGSGRS